MENQNGEEVLSVTATDNEGKSAALVFNLIVKPVNDEPMVGDVIPDVMMEEDGPEVIVDLSQAFTDVDIETNDETNKDQLSFEVSGGETLLTYSLEGSPGALVLKLLLLENQNGQAVLDITATDIEGASATVPLTLVVTPMNDVPLAVDDVALAKQLSLIHI